MAQKRRRRTDHFVLIDAILIMVAAILVFLVYREINTAPVKLATKSAQLVYHTSGMGLPEQQLVDSKAGNLEEVSLRKWINNTQLNAQNESAELQLGFYSPLKRFSEISSPATSYKKDVFAIFKSGSRDPVQKTVSGNDGMYATILGPVYAARDCTDCSSLGLPEYKKGDLIGVREISYRVEDEFARAINMLLAALSIMATALCVTSIFLLPMIRRTYDDTKSIIERAASAEKQALTDSLTGLHNRRYFELALKGFIQEFSQLNRKFGLLVLDLDHFKSVNDNYGHDTGDMVLREVGLRLMAVAREHDVIARIGGEEFAIITPFADEKKLAAIAERFRTNIEGLKLTVNSTILRPTVSIGVAVSSPDMKDIHELFQRADQKLYEAKNAGRNRVAA